MTRKQKEEEYSYIWLCLHDSIKLEHQKIQNSTYKYYHLVIGKKVRYAIEYKLKNNLLLINNSKK